MFKNLTLFMKIYTWYAQVVVLALLLILCVCVCVSSLK